MNAYEIMRVRLACARFLTATKKSALERDIQSAVSITEAHYFFTHKVVCV